MDKLCELLERKYGKVKVYSDFYYFECPTCAPADKNKKKRYIRIGGYKSSCWICEQVIPIDDLLGGHFVVKDLVANREEKPREENPLNKTLPGRRFIPINELPQNHIALNFLAKDHLYDLDKYANDYGIVYCPSDGGLILRRSTPFISSAERLIFPVVFKSIMVGWQMRSIPGTVYGDLPDCLKYFHLFSKGEVLYNYDKAKQYPFVIVVEGVKKALKFNNAVATFGKGISRRQIQLIQEWHNIVLMLDSEEETQQEARNIAKNINMNGKNCINIDLGKYGLPSPDEGRVEQLNEIVVAEYEENLKKNENKNMSCK